MNRRNFIKAAVGASGAAGLAGCSSLSDDSDQQTDTSDQTTDQPTGTDEATTQDPTYSIQASPLEYDLTDLAASDTNEHDQAYVEDNYSAELGVTVLNNGEEADLEDLSEVHLEDEEGEAVETTEDGYVPEYAVEDGQELTVRAEVEGETLEETVTVNKELPSEFYADARIQENGETLYDTDWSTPYNFDNHIVDRQAFIDQRAERRDELADDELILESDLETWRGYFEEEEDELSEEEKKAYYLGGLSFAMEGGGPYEGTGADNNAFNLEKAMWEHSTYEPVFIGGFTNPKEPNVPSAGDGDGFEVESDLAYVDGDWYHGTDDFGFQHIDEIENNVMAQEDSGITAVSVLAEFERGNTDLQSSDDANEIVEETVTSQVTLNDNLAELELNDDISWSALNQIRENTGWEEVMVPMELATAVGTDVDGSVEMEGESTMDSRIKVTR